MSRRGIWRTSKSKAKEITDMLLKRKLAPERRIVLPDGRDAKCAQGNHKFAGMKIVPPYEREPGFWVERYIPLCSICGAQKVDENGKPMMFDGQRIRPNLGEVWVNKAPPEPKKIITGD